jgi:hypothetical protein
MLLAVRNRIKTAVNVWRSERDAKQLC